MGDVDDQDPLVCILGAVGSMISVEGGGRRPQLAMAFDVSRYAGNNSQPGISVGVNSACVPQP